MNKEKKDLLIFGGVFTGVWGFFFFRSFLKHGWTILGAVFLAVSATTLMMVLFRRDWLAAVQKGLARMAHPIGNALTSLMMMAVFYLIFTPVAIILKVAGKDLLDEKIDGSKNSYWLLREKKPFKKEDYLRQF